MADIKIIEQNTRLSKSLLWELQVAAYSQFGPTAWFGKNVPFYITSNPLIARQYAQVVAGFIRDCLAPDAVMPLNRKEPLHIFDLGAGTGRFGYLFLKSLLEMLANLFKEPVKIRYVMTDIAKSNIDFWSAHPYLQPFVKEGSLDFCYFYHAEKTKSLQLIRSEEILSPETLRNPLVVMGNYFFDTIPHDIFRVKNHVLEEGRTTLSYMVKEENKDLSPTDPALISFLDQKTEFFPVENIENYYPDNPECNKILQSYATRFENIPFLFPVGAFQTIRYFKELSNNRFMLMAGDQGMATEKQLLADAPFFAKHSSFSISVNYHAIASYFKNSGGTSLLTTHNDSRMIHIATTSIGGPRQFRDMCEGFRLSLETFEPNDYYRLIEYTEFEWKAPNLRFILKLIKLGLWDPVNFNMFFSKIQELLPTADEETKDELVQTIYEVWNKFFPVCSEEGAFVMNLGVLFSIMNRNDEALLFFNRALDLRYEAPLVYRNISIIYRKKGQIEEADKWLKIAYELRDKNMMEP